MKCDKILIVISFFSLSLLSCSKDNPLNSTSSNSIVLLNYSFEGNGLGSLQGWRYGDSLANNYFTLSNEVPPAGGSWSLLMKSDTTKSRDLLYTIIPPRSSYSKTITLSFNVKSTGNILGYIDLSIWGSNVNLGPTLVLGNFINWDTASYEMGSATSIDSIVIDLRYHFGGQYYGQMWFDNIKVEEVSQ